MDFVPTVTVPDSLRSELDEVDDALARIPSAHLRTPFGLRRLSRGQTLVCDARRYPTVLATYQASAGTARLYQPSFGARPSWVTWPGERSVTAIVHTLVGCSLAHDDELYRGFSRAIGRLPAEIPGVLLLERGAIDRVLTRAGSRLTLDWQRLTPGLDLGVAYAAFLSQAELLRVCAPAVHDFLAAAVFAPARQRSGGAKKFPIHVPARH